MVPGLNFSQKKSGVHPVKFFEKDSRAYLTRAYFTGPTNPINTINLYTLFPQSGIKLPIILVSSYILVSLLSRSLSLMPKL